MVAGLIESINNGHNQFHASIIVAAVIVPILIPIIHLGYVFRIWNSYTRLVDRETCSCSCWDTAFKANYEVGIGRYKHVYFNVTWETSRIWILIVTGVVLTYEVTKYILHLLIESRLRITMAVLIVSNIFPHYYGWWAYFNYYNDDYFTQWYHQLYYSITELICSTCAVLMLDSRKPVRIKYALLIMSISLGHILCSGYDQFVRNVLFREGINHQVLRDIGLMIPDILHFAIPICEIHKLGHPRKIPGFYLVSNKEAILVLLIVATICILNMTLF